MPNDCPISSGLQKSNGSRVSPDEQNNAVTASGRVGCVVMTPAQQRKSMEDANRRSGVQ